MSDTSKSLIKGVYILPGQPHLLRGDLNAGYKRLVEAMKAVKHELERSGVRRIIYYSTQWIAVLDQLIQARAELSGTHVDDNWHEYGDLPFAFRVDTTFAQQCSQALAKSGFTNKLVDYEGFPVDTGTIVADRLINPSGRIKTNMIACNVYTNFDETIRLASVVGEAARAICEDSAVVCISSLSGRWFTTDIDLREDHIRDPADDDWNRRMIQLLEQGDDESARHHLREHGAKARVDMGFKAYAFVLGILNGCSKAQCLAYEPIYGTGAAVLKFN